MKKYLSVGLVSVLVLAGGLFMNASQASATPSLFSTVSGMKWNDANSNRQDDDESIIAGWGIDLFQYRTDGDTIAIKELPEKTTTTDSDGNYIFENLDPDINYIVCEENRSGWEQTSPTLVSDGTHACANGTVGYTLQGGEARDFTFKNFGNHEIDVCPNLENAQAEVPQGKELNSDGMCVDVPQHHGGGGRIIPPKNSGGQEGGQVLGAETGPIGGCDDRTTGFSITTGQSCVGNNGKGQVLGAETCNLDRTMRLWMKGCDVLALHNRLTELGYYKGLIDDKFGLLLRAAVIKFQLANGLKGDGVVGPATRALLNK